MLIHFRLHYLALRTIGLPLTPGSAAWHYWSIEARLHGRNLRHGGIGRTTFTIQ